MVKKIIAFDQDDTLNVTKLPIEPEMAELLTELLDKYEVCVISGCSYEVMKKNEPDQMKKASDKELEKLHLMPTCGAQYWRYENGNWARKYAHFLSDEQVSKISKVIETAAKKLDFWCKNPTGEIIENRGSQVTFSALGQWATPQDKHAWDSHMRKRQAIVEIIKPELPGLEIKIGGGTSIDVTLPNIDKAYGMKQLMAETGYKKDEILYIGDKLDRDGNDYPVKAMGIDTIAVTRWQDTANVLRGILAVS
ncbi:HAD-IIB family hydrolase [Candidatus Saccharibacteria bacterium]|nr:HAD-IIB family hydrolase [Candidatus Saccharibacteria bacterium]